MTPRSADRLATITHFLTAFVILMKGIAKAEHFHGHEALVIFLFAAAAYIGVGAAIHHRFHGRSGELIQASFYLVEAVICVLIGRYSAAEGAKMLPYAFHAAAAGFTVALAVNTVVALKKHRSHAASPTR